MHPIVYERLTFERHMETGPSHTRIDDFVLSAQLTHSVVETEYLSRTISGHSSLTLSVWMLDGDQGTYRWRLNPTPLK
jgi:hypothetical protein